MEAIYSANKVEQINYFIFMNTNQIKKQNGMNEMRVHDMNIRWNN